jgi:hypothetical protein
MPKVATTKLIRKIRGCIKLHYRETNGEEKKERLQ